MVGCDQEEGQLNLLHGRRTAGVSVDKVGRGIEKTPFSRTLERHKTIAKNEEGGCWVGHLRRVEV